MFLPADAIKIPYNIETSNPDIVNIQGDKIYANALGSTNLTVTTNSGISKVIGINVMPIPVTSLKIIPEQVKLKVGENSNANVSFTPTNATDKTLVWSTSNEKIATVDNEGKITANSIGQCAVTATSSNGISAYCIATVISTPAETLSLDKSLATLHVGDIIKLTAEVLPETTTDKTIIWTTSDTNVAIVDKEGSVIAQGLGEAIITAKCGTLTAKCTIKVVETPVTSITIDKTSVEMRVAETVQLTAIILPENATNKNVVWTSFNESVATVSDNGLVTAQKEGSAIISVKCGSLTALCQLNVIDTEPESIILDISQVSLEVTEKIQLIASILPETTTDKSVIWSTSDANIAKVDKTGLVTAVSVGKTTVTATTANGLKATCVITVAETPASGIFIDKESLGITGNNLEMRVGDVKTIKVTVEPATTTDKTLTFASSNTEVASVDATGKITALLLGETTITITAKSGVSAQIAVKVVATPAASISLNKTEATLKATETLKLEATVAPETTTDKTVTWTTSDAGIAKVDENGTVTAVSVGIATVTATTANGLKGSCEITVAETPASGIFIDKESLGITGDRLEMRVGDVKTINVTVEPATTTDKTVTFASSNTEVVTVDATGKITALSLGNSIITVSCGNASAACTVYVIPTQVESITLDETELTLKKSETFQLSATVSPITATNKDVAWSSSDTSVATIDNNGLVTALSFGTCTITASASDGSGVSASCVVSVEPILVESLAVSPEEFMGKTGDSFKIETTILPENADNKKLDFSSSNDNVAVVNDLGVVSLKKEGLAIIKVMTTDGSNIEAQCVIASTSGIEGLFTDEACRYDVYSMTGILLRKEADMEYVARLSKGIYILIDGNKVVKLNLTGK